MSDKKSCSRIEERSVIKFLVAEGCKAVEILGECQQCMQGPVTKV